VAGTSSNPGSTTARRTLGGRKLSELDRDNPSTWDPDWTTEAIDLLTVLTRLVELEPAQADVLSHVLAGAMLTMDDLRAAGTRWPVGNQDRKPRFSYDSLRRADSSSYQITLDE
jgi:hypothetical protein